MPPHSVEAEQSVLGGLMLDNNAWDKVADLVAEDDFYRRDHRLIFRAINELIERRQPCDAVTISETLESHGELGDVGGLAYLGTLARETPSAANVRAYASIVRERAILRRLIQVGGEIAQSVYAADGREAGELIDEAERRVFEIADSGQRRGSGFQPLKEILTKSLDRLDTLYNTEGDITGVATGYNEMDKKTAGLQRGDLIVIAGRPSMGKSSLAVNIAENAALSKAGIPTAIFSMEMSAEQLSFRMIGSIGRVNQSSLRTGNISDDDWDRVNSSVKLMTRAPIFIDDTPALSPTEVRARARRLKREHGLGLIIVDYLQLMQVAGTKENRATEISEISRSLKALAKELDLPIIALSQLNRSVEQRTDKRPVMSDLRECVASDTLVLLADGRRVPICELIGSQPQVLSMSPQGKVVAAKSDKVWCVGKRPLLEIVLASGRRLRATAQHRLYGGDGWQRVDELRIGERLAYVKRMPEKVAFFRQTYKRAATRERIWHSLVKLSAAHSNVPTAMATLSGASVGFDLRPCFASAYPSWAANTRFGQANAIRDLTWDPITSVEPAGEAEVFDLTVPGLENWLADGIVSHNSGAIEQDADLIVFIYRDEVYNPDTQRKGIADIIIAKQRNGPIGDFRLTFLGEYTRFENLVAEAYGDEAWR